MSKTAGKGIVITGRFAATFFFIGAAVTASGSWKMRGLRSVGGNSVAEAFYQEAGLQGYGYSLAFLGFGLATLAICKGLGLILDTFAQHRETRQKSHVELIETLEVMGKELLFAGNKAAINIQSLKQ